MQGRVESGHSGQGGRGFEALSGVVGETVGLRGLNGLLTLQETLSGPSKSSRHVL